MCPVWKKFPEWLTPNICGKFKRWMRKTQTYHVPSLCILLCLLNDKLVIIWLVLRISVYLHFFVNCAPLFMECWCLLNEIMLFLWGCSYCSCPLFIILRNHILLSRPTIQVAMSTQHYMKLVLHILTMGC